MIDQRYRSEQRRQRILKAKLYKQILDNQVEFNQRMRQQQQRQATLQSQRYSLDHKKMKVQKQKEERMIYSRLLQSSRRLQQEEDKVFVLPSIRKSIDRNYQKSVDKNIRYYGQSRFLELEQPQTPKKGSRRFYTEPVDSDQSIEDVINQLKSINARMVSNRSRKVKPTPSRRQKYQTPKVFFSDSYLHGLISMHGNQAYNPEQSQPQAIVKAASIGNNIGRVEDTNTSRLNFLAVLKKIRNRGQSLALKLQKHPKLQPKLPAPT